MQPTVWPEHFQRIQRITFSTIPELIEVLKPFAESGKPVVIEGTKTIDVEKWADIEPFLSELLGDRKVSVKRSSSQRFRYFDLSKNTGEFDFQEPVEELSLTFAEFLKEVKALQAAAEADEQKLASMYLQESLNGHEEMAKEFGSWNWELLLAASIKCGWGLPTSNELFVGMCGVETPLHFDERENLFCQVRGRKEIVVFPFVDYTKLYPFPTTHPCDRQSMVGSPVQPDLGSFPKFSEAVGHTAVLKAGDLLYLPYGWWHWLRNLDHLTASISFWSTTPPADLSLGLLELSDSMLTRVRRNLENILAQKFGEKRHPETMLLIWKALKDNENKDLDQMPLQEARSLLSALKLPPEKQDSLLLDMIDGRFGIDYNKYV
mmetsp:Transcript_57473/g.136683  ORF Transcript_57473/g.136683 Transcript_57473/m.136683 type:complete len:377 (-) Transcript_57473:304-1434(-)